MKRIAWIVLFFVLLLTEAYVCAAFLPMSWQIAIQRVLPSGRDHSYTTHPNLEGEIDQALRHHPGLRATFYAVLVLLLAGNTLLLVLVWKRLRRMSPGATLDR